MMGDVPYPRAKPMEASPESLASRLAPSGSFAWLRPILALVLLFVFLVGVQGLAAGVKGLGSDALDAFMTAVENPFLGLVTGILATTLVQSSSVTTSLVVGMVGSGALSVGAAVPMVMGANIGTTVTNTVAALTQVGGARNAFRRAFAAATCHDFFNYLAVIVLLPVEIVTGLLGRTAEMLVSWLPETGAAGAFDSPAKLALKASVSWLEGIISLLFEDRAYVSGLLIVASIALIFVALTLIVKVMRRLVLGRLQGFVRQVLNRGASGLTAAFGLGMIITILVQSSSITTSIMVPLAGAGVVRLWQVLPVTVGANIGTTVTALIASLGVTGVQAGPARQIALVHLLFNLAGTLLFYVPARTRRYPMYMAQRLARVATRSRPLAVAYVVAAFYGVPAVLVYLFGR